jgi:hypothetical protein
LFPPSPPLCPPFNFDPPFSFRATCVDSWHCDVGHYGTSNGCDCSCGAFDPDCEDAGASVQDCSLGMWPSSLPGLFCVVPTEGGGGGGGGCWFLWG